MDWSSAGIRHGSTPNPRADSEAVDADWYLTGGGSSVRMVECDRDATVMFPKSGSLEPRPVASILGKRAETPTEDFGGDTDRNALGGFAHRVAREMRIPCGRLQPAVTGEPADYRQPLAERGSA